MNIIVVLTFITIFVSCDAFSVSPTTHQNGFNGMCKLETCSGAVACERSRTELTNMNEDCQVLILEELDLKSLRNMALTNRHFSDLAANVFKKKLSSRTVVIDELGIVNDFENWTELISKDLYQFWTSFVVSPDYIRISDEYIHIRQPRSLIDVLQNFGDAITKLKIHGFYNGLPREIAELVNEYCSETLTDLEIHFSYKSEVLKYMKKPFEKVENLTFGFYFNENGENALPLDQLFPEVRHLKMVLRSKVNSGYVVRYLPHLDSVTMITGFANHNGKSESNEVKFIKINPQIKNIALENPSLELLNAVAEHLPNLNSLTFNEFNSDVEFNFKNVTTFELYDYYCTPESIRFENIEELRMSCLSETCEKWLIFIKKHPNLKRLIMDSSCLDDEIFLQFTENLPNLEELTISLFKGREISSQNLVKFMQSHDKLKQFNLETEHVPSNFQDLAKTLEMKWTIQHIPGEHLVTKEKLTFERIH